MSGVRAALFWSLTERYLLIVLALASNIILARLLTPEEVGIYSVSLAVIGVAQVLRDFGIGNFLIQEKDLSDDHIRTAFGLSLLIGFSLFVVTFGGAGLLADLYKEPRMAGPLRICALNFVVLPFCTVSLALLRRAMAFRQLMFVTLAASVLSFVVTIALALLGQGSNSMAIGSVVLNAATGVGSWLARGDRQMLAPSFKAWRSLVRFGAHSSAANVVTSISMDINDLALGKILGFAPVALYSRAQGLVSLFSRDVLGAIRNVALPAYAQAHREGRDLEPQCVTAMASVIAVGWPFFGFLSLYPLELIRLLYGPQWDAAAALVPVLALAGAAYVTASLVYPAVTAVGRVDLVSRAELVFQPLRAAAIVLAAVQFKSLLACAAAYAVMMIGYVPLAFSVKNRCIPNDHAALLRHGLVSFALTLITLAIPAAIALYHGLSRQQPMPLAWFVGAAALGTLSWLGGIAALKHPVARMVPGMR